MPRHELGEPALNGSEEHFALTQIKPKNEVDMG